MSKSATSAAMSDDTARKILAGQFHLVDRAHEADARADELADSIRRIELRQRMDSASGGASRSLGERVTGAPEYLRARELHDRSAVDVKIPGLLSTRGLVDTLRLRTTLDTTTGAGLVHQGETLVSYSPLPARLASLVRTVELDQPIVRETSTTTWSGMAAETPEDSLYPELTSLALTTAQVNLAPFASSGEVTRGNMNDSGLFRAAVDTLFRRDFTRALENSLLNGTTDGVFGGILAAGAGITTVAKGSGSRLAALATGMSDVMDQGYGYEGGLAAIGSPDTLRAIFATETSTGQAVDVLKALPFVSQFVPVAGVPAGDVILGSFFDAVALFINGDLTLELANSHADFFVTGKVAVRLTLPYAASRVTRPDALVVVTGVG